MDNFTEQVLFDHEADRQTRETYRYFQPTNPAALNATWSAGEYLTSHVGPSTASCSSTSVLDDNVSETASIDANLLYSPNTTLTSLAQLAALRLNAQRAFITILNRDSQFVLAEATKTTNVGTSTLFGNKGDNLFAGTSTLTSTWNICQETINILPPEHQDGTYPFLIVNDLQQEERFKALPFVQGEPHSRFYAGTPLTSDSNINLGCLFILDPEPREGLSDTEKDILGTVGAMVMEYLRVSRQAVEGHRASRLSQGLRLFVDGNSSFADHVPLAHQNSSNWSPHSYTSPYRRQSRSADSQHSDSNLRTAQFETDDVVPLSDAAARSASPFSGEDLRAGISASPAPSSHSSRHGDGGSMVSSNTDWLFQRAANLIRQSLDLDGAGSVMFLETSDDCSDSFTHSALHPADAETPGPLLAFSTREDPFSYMSSTEVSYPAVKLDNAFLNQLSRRYPKGRLWSFHRDGSLSTSDEEQSVGASRKYNLTSRALEAKTLKAFFPDATQVMFVPLWNATSLQWFAGCFSWTTQSTRVFSRDIDLSSIFGFASSIMTEYSRVESVVADRQKGDFIGSISHELRSPLHGVLAAAEFLGDTQLDQFQESLLETVNSCGRTLLDTLNQVLDFSKILSLERQKKRQKRKKDPWRPKAPDDIPVRLDPPVSTNVATLIEDVVDSVCLGHSHIQRSTMPVDHPIDESPNLSSSPSKQANKIGWDSNVEVILDISGNDWLYNVQAGSLRRIVMNLLGNALKYTKRGLVSVSIQATENSKGRSRRQGLEDMVTLTVSDTGIGMSDEYLQTRLYTPFAQEDTLSVGTGLGLSIVRGIVKTLHGNIRIKSRKGEGTTVKVIIPLERPVGENSSSSTPYIRTLEQQTLTTPYQLRQLDLTGKRIAIWGVDPSCLGEHHFWSSIAQYIIDWYGLKLVPWSAHEHVDVLLANESDSTEEELQCLHAPLPSILVFRSDTGNAGDTRTQWSRFAESLVMLRRPCGPQKLAKGILNCLYPKSPSSTPCPARPKQELVIPERPRPSGSNPSTGDSISSTSGSLQAPLTESANIKTVSRSYMEPAERKSSDQSSRTDSSRLTPGSGASSAQTPSLSSSASSYSDPTCSNPSSGAQIKPRVLLVDDNDINLRLIQTFMKKWKLTNVDTAQNGREAVDLVEKTPLGYDLIFMDMSMPIMNGFEATRTIRAIEKERGNSVSAKIIAFTGLSSLRDESEALESGVDVFLTKPVSFKQVSRLIEDWEIRLSE
ncbi:uncharacterized protein N7511_010310 [Penicillium nucicola]|uniref:uncharacterized protein n=1 Tax=Penicillium nucicola TaxID=1850975 RepID=UPI002545BA3F|nr:uncharacterized protein N7511_010310 [Penicillium nucicola]KAJ5748614.1 hypothetical protein N7511_010310 [Penicillium nucicola]